MKTFANQLEKLVTSSILVKTPVPYSTAGYDNFFSYSYNGSCLFSTTSDLYTAAVSDGVTLLFPIPHEMRFCGKETHIRMLVDAIHYTHFPDSIFFLNGGVRAAFLDKILNRLSNNTSTDRRRWIGTRLMCEAVSKNWGKFSEEAKARLADFFDADGDCELTKVQGYVLSGTSGSVKKINASSYRRSPQIIADCIGVSVVYVKADSPATNTVTVRGSEYNLNEDEFKVFSDLYSQCSSCGGWEVSSGFMFGSCSKCVGEVPKLKGYSERATSFFEPIVGKSKYSPRLLGVELEYEYSSESKANEALFLISKAVGQHAIMKRDGSLSNGVEICTRPASVDIHLEEFTKMFEDERCMERIIVKESCGMHVHIDRRKMTALTLGKLIKFMQDAANKSFLEAVAGRESNSYTKLGTGLSVTSQHRRIASGERYQGVNVQNEQTAEIRIFRTPNNFTTFLQNMEFVTAVADFTQPANSGVNGLSYGAMIKFVQENRSTYKQLAKFFKETF